MEPIASKGTHNSFAEVMSCLILFHWWLDYIIDSDVNTKLKPSLSCENHKFVCTFDNL